MFHFEEKKERFVLWILTGVGVGAGKRRKKGGLSYSLLNWVTSVEHMWTQRTHVAGATARPRCVQDAKEDWGLPAAVSKGNRGRVLHIFCPVTPMNPFRTRLCNCVHMHRLPADETGKAVLFIQKDLPMPLLLVRWVTGWAVCVLWGSCIGFLPSAPSLPWCEGDQVCHLWGKDRENPVSYIQNSGLKSIPWKVEGSLFHNCSDQ